MKVAILCIFAAANLIVAEGKALGYPFKGDIEREELGHHPFLPKYDITENNNRLDLNAFKDLIKQKLDTLTRHSKRLGFDVDDLKKRTLEQLDKFKGYAKKKGVDVDALKEKLIGEFDQFKRKVKDYDVDALKHKVNAQVQRIKDMAKGVDMNWARRIFHQVKEKGSKVLGRKDEGTITKLKRKSKEAVENFFSKLFD